MIDKSILIISTPRTGSTSLLYSFMDKFNIFDNSRKYRGNLYNPHTKKVI